MQVWLSEIEVETKLNICDKLNHIKKVCFKSINQLKEIILFKSEAITVALADYFKTMDKNDNSSFIVWCYNKGKFNLSRAISE